MVFPEVVKIAKLAEVLKVSCDYLLREDKTVTAEVSMTSANSYVVDWTKLYPILGQYQNTVDCVHYHKTFKEMIKEMMVTHRYTLEDTVLVLKDLLYQVHVEMQKEENKTMANTKLAIQIPFLKNLLFFKLLAGSVVILFDNLLVRTGVGQVRMEAGNDACCYPAIMQEIWQQTSAERN
ncbi:MAG: hypothetical protein K6T85_08730 [Gorillibacterium sp.]|nr:hypothetical protein [Gorillibacterium sp.]